MKDSASAAVPKSVKEIAITPILDLSTLSDTEILIYLAQQQGYLLSTLEDFEKCYQYDQLASPVAIAAYNKLIIYFPHILAYLSVARAKPSLAKNESFTMLDVTLCNIQLPFRFFLGFFHIEHDRFSEATRDFRYCLDNLEVYELEDKKKIILTLLALQYLSGERDLDSLIDSKIKTLSLPVEELEFLKIKAKLNLATVSIRNFKFTTAENILTRIFPETEKYPELYIMTFALRCQLWYPYYQSLTLTNLQKEKKFSEFLESVNKNSEELLKKIPLACALPDKFLNIVSYLGLIIGPLLEAYNFYRLLAIEHKANLLHKNKLEKSQQFIAKSLQALGLIKNLLQIIDENNKYQQPLALSIVASNVATLWPVTILSKLVKTYEDQTVARQTSIKRAVEKVIELEKTHTEELKRKSEFAEKLSEEIVKESEKTKTDFKENKEKIKTKILARNKPVVVPKPSATTAPAAPQKMKKKKKKKPAKKISEKSNAIEEARNFFGENKFPQAIEKCKDAQVAAKNEHSVVGQIEALLLQFDCYFYQTYNAAKKNTVATVAEHYPQLTTLHQEAKILLEANKKMLGKRYAELNQCWEMQGKEEKDLFKALMNKKYNKLNRRTSEFALKSAQRDMVREKLGEVRWTKFSGKPLSEKAKEFQATQKKFSDAIEQCAVLSALKKQPAHSISISTKEFAALKSVASDEIRTRQKGFFEEAKARYAKQLAEGADKKSDLSHGM